MDAKEFYNNGIGEEIEQVHKNITIELMENYAKHYHQSKVKTLGLFSVSERYLHINEVAMLIKNMPTGQAIQTIKAALSGQPETTVIDGELLVSYHNAL
jgi:hypothetical protein